SSIAQTPYVMEFWQGPDTRHDSASTIAADLFSTILSLNSSKFQQALIDKGLATSVQVQYQTEKYVGPVFLFAVPNPNKMNEFLAELDKQIAMWSDPGYYTDEQLEDAKGILRRSFIRQQ